MSTRRRSSESPVSIVQLLGLFAVSLIFFAAAVIGGFLAGYQRGIIAQAFGSPPEPVPLIESLLGGPPVAVQASETAPTTDAPPELTALQPSSPAAPELTPEVVTRPNATPDAAARSTHLQVAAGRDLKGAQRLARELAAKGYAAVVYSGGNDGLHRVIVGPYDGRSAAKAIQTKLKADGHNSLIRIR